MLQMITMGAVGVLTASFIAFVVAVASIGGDLVNPGKNGLQEYMSTTSGLEAKNNTRVSGSEVRSLLDDYKLNNNCSVTVFTKKCPEGFFLNSHVTELDSSFYINPAADFFLTLLHDTDMQIIQICCTQVGVDAQAAIQTNPDLPSKFLQEAEKLSDKAATLPSIQRVVPEDLANSYFYYQYFGVMDRVLGGT